MLIKYNIIEYEWITSNCQNKHHNILLLFAKKKKPPPLQMATRYSFNDNLNLLRSPDNPLG